MIFQVVYSGFSIFIYLPFKHYREYLVDKVKSSETYDGTQELPNPNEEAFGLTSLTWLLLLYGYAIFMGVNVLNESVHFCRGSQLTDEQKDNEDLKKLFDISVGGFTYTFTIVHLIICGCIILGGIIYGILYKIKGKEWMDEKTGKTKPQQAKQPEANQIKDTDNSALPMAQLDNNNHDKV